MFVNRDTDKHFFYLDMDFKFEVFLKCMIISRDYLKLRIKNLPYAKDIQTK